MMLQQNKIKTARIYMEQNKNGPCSICKRPFRPNHPLLKGEKNISLQCLKAKLEAEAQGREYRPIPTRSFTNRCEDCGLLFTPQNPRKSQNRHETCYHRYIYKISPARRLSIRNSQYKYYARLKRENPERYRNIAQSGRRTMIKQKFQQILAEKGLLKQ